MHDSFIPASFKRRNKGLWNFTDTLGKYKNIIKVVPILTF